MVPTGDPEQSAALAILPSGPLRGELRAPSSKSMTNRLLVIGALAEGRSRLANPLVSDDTTVMAAALSDLGAETSLGEQQATIAGSGGMLRRPRGVLWAGLSGTTLRYLCGLSLLVEGPVTLDGEPPLRRRPLGGLIAALEAAGADVVAADQRAPLTISGAGIAGGRLVVDAGASSQFATALLLVAPYARKDVELEIRNLSAPGYVELTVDAMRRYGAAVEEVGPFHYRIAHSQRYGGRKDAVEYDASAAAHLFALAMATGGSVTVENAVSTRQPDAGILRIFEEMGAGISASTGPVTVRRGGLLRGIDTDLSTMPDQVATLAVLGALADGPTLLTGIGVVRGHETDRIAALEGELSKLGAAVEAGPDWLRVEGGRQLHGGRVDTHDDHRLAMAFTALGAVVEGIEIASPGCVAKTYPRWWDDAAALGLRLGG